MRAKKEEEREKELRQNFLFVCSDYVE